MLVTDIVTSPEELEQILSLQKRNLKENLTLTERNEQGFLTLQHSLPILKAMHAMAPSVIVKDDGQVVAYALTEMAECRHLMPQLGPMFSLIDQLSWKGRPINEQRFYTMGQICVAEGYRGQGLFGKLYQHHRKVYHQRFDLFITEISTSNHRSIRAHEKVGFEPLHLHKDDIDEWLMVIWDWRDDQA